VIGGGAGHDGGEAKPADRDGRQPRHTQENVSPTGPEDHNTRNYLAQDTGCTLSERRAAGRICSVVSGLRGVTVTCDRHGGEHHALPG